MCNRCRAILHVGTHNSKNMAAFKQNSGLAVQVPLDLGDIAVIYCTVHLCGIHSRLFLPRTCSTILVFFKEIAEVQSELFL